MNYFQMPTFGSQQMLGKLSPVKKLIWLLFLCIGLVGCTSVRRDNHVFSASVLGFAGNYIGAHRQFQDAFKIDLAHLHRKVVPDCDTLVWYDNWSGQDQEALPHCEQALTNCMKVTDVNGEGWCFNLMGWQYLRWPHERDKAIESFEKALAIFEQTKNGNGEANSLSGLGSVYDSLNHYGSAIECFEHAKVICEYIKDKRSESHMLNFLGAEYYTLGQHDKALGYFNQALALQPIYAGTRFFPAVKVPDLDDLAVCYDNVGQTCSSMGQHKQAIRDYKRAMLYHTIFRNGTAVDWCFNRLGWEYESIGEHHKALLCYKWALVGRSRLRRSAATRDCDGSCLCNLGYTYESLGRRDKALRCYQQSLAIFREVQDRSSEANTLDTLMAFWRQGKPNLAIFYGKQAVNVYQEIRGNIQTMDKEIQKSFLISHESTYRKLADLLINEGRLSEAEQVLNMLKQEEYFDFVRRDSSETSAQTASVEFTPVEAKWNSNYLQAGQTVTALGVEYDALQAKPNRTEKENQHLNVLHSELLEAGEAFQKQLDQLDKETGADVRTEVRVQMVHQAQSLMGTLGDLGPGVVALYTVVCDDKYHVILVTPDVEKAAEYTIKSSDLNHKVMDFREALCDPGIDPRPLASELYQILVAPVAKDLEGAKAKTLMWSLDGVLRYIPIAALYDGHQYMVERYQNVVFTPESLPKLEDAVSVKWKGLGLGVSKPHGDFLALPGVHDELLGIIHEAGATNQNAIMQGTVLMDQDFTADTMISSLYQRFPLVHIASHFQFQPGDETSSFLLLGDGSHFTLDRLKVEPNIFRGVELLTLSACDTAVDSENADGREVDGFATLAQNEGAKAVVASLWPVADQSTQLLMREFYRLREENPGMPKSEALREAQLALLHGEIQGYMLTANRGFNLNKKQVSSTSFPFNPDAPFAHPYFWSPFILIGNWK